MIGMLWAGDCGSFAIFIKSPSPLKMGMTRSVMMMLGSKGAGEFEGFDAVCQT